MDPARDVLEVLYDRRPAFVPAEELARIAGVAVGRVAGLLDTLRRRGHRIDTSPASGVRLADPIRLDAHLIERGLAAERVGRNVICFDEVDSTNDVAAAAAAQPDADGLAVIAESQRSGRGRQGRRWISRPGANVLMSVVLIDADDALAAEVLTISAGLAVAEGIEGACDAACHLKWPNDVLIDGRKVAGVLVERRRRCYVVGAGINANQAPPADAVDAPAGAIADSLGRPVDRIALTRAVFERMDAWLRAIARGRIDALHEAWMSRCGMLNERIVVSSGGRRYVGRVLDVHPLAGLMLCDDQGRRVHLPAETSSILPS